jgi:hypothetical protein
MTAEQEQAVREWIESFPKSLYLTDSFWSRTKDLDEFSVELTKAGQYSVYVRVSLQTGCGHYATCWRDMNLESLIKGIAECYQNIQDWAHSEAIRLLAQ